MAWNEPGGGNKDPWSGKGGNEGPPDLDEVVRNIQEKLGGLFGGRKSGGGGDGSGKPSGAGKLGIGLIAGVILLGWLATGIYIVEPAERGVVMRFGAYKEVTQPGPHWHLPYPIEDVIKVNVDQVSSLRHKAEMLTRDENIVDVELTVQFRIQDASDYLFQDQQPDKTIRDATETAVRETIGKSDLDFVLTEGRSSIAARIKQRIQELLNNYHTGLEAMSVNMQPAKPPDEVKGAFDDAIKAREDKERLENEAQAYANEIVPKARGAAARRVADAKAYRKKVIADSEGETSRFLAILTEYEKAPKVTRERLYLDTVEDVLSNTRKVFMDTQGGNNLMMLPLDKMFGGKLGSASNNGPRLPSESTFSSRKPPAKGTRDVSRSRRTR